MRLPLAVAVVTVATLTACAPQSKDFTPKTDEEKQLYTLGVLLSKNVETFDFTDKEIEIVKAGLDQGSRGKGKLENEEMEALIPKLQELQGKRAEAAGAKAKTDGEAYLAKAAAEKDVTKLPSGVIYKVLKAGTGASPTATDTVKVNYEGKLTGGKVFDSSAKHGGPAEFPLGGMIPCWTEGVPQMKVGGKAQLICPSATAYGAQPPPGIPANSTLIFEVELLDIVAPQAAAEGAAPPADAAHPAH